MEGNQMKMREALERLDNKIVSMQCDTSSQKRKVDECRMIIRKVLSLPPRNCDVGTAEEQYARFREYCFSKRCDSLITKNTLGSEVAFAWAQMPYEEGGAK